MCDLVGRPYFAFVRRVSGPSFAGSGGRLGRSTAAAACTSLIAYRGKALLAEEATLEGSHVN